MAADSNKNYCCLSTMSRRAIKGSVKGFTIMHHQDEMTQEWNPQVVEAIKTLKVAISEDMVTQKQWSDLSEAYGSHDVAKKKKKKKKQDQSMFSP